MYVLTIPQELDLIVAGIILPGLPLGLAQVLLIPVGVLGHIVIPPDRVDPQGDHQVIPVSFRRDEAAAADLYVRLLIAGQEIMLAHIHRL